MPGPATFDTELLRELTEAPGVPGQEAAVADIMAARMAGLGQIARDGLGGLSCTSRGSHDAPRVAIAAHMDEVGFVVREVTEEGFLRFLPLGGWWEQVMLAQRVRVHTRVGPVDGIVGSKAPHVLPPEERNKVVQRSDMFIDIGASSRTQAAAWGVRPGDPVVPVSPFGVLHDPDLLVGKAMDDRAGCAILVETFRALSHTPHPNTVVGLATVQEEVGLRGAEAARSIPADVAIALDVGIAGDTPGMRPEQATARLGKGPLVFIHDASLVPNPRLRDLIADTAEAEGIPFQWDALPGGSFDTGRLQFGSGGTPSVVIGFPARYIHSAVSIVHRGDLAAAVRLVTAAVAKMDAATVLGLRG